MERITVTIEARHLARIRQVAGTRGVSRFVNEAVARHLARQEILGMLDELDAKYGVPSAELEAEIDREARRFFGGRSRNR